MRADIFTGNIKVDPSKGEIKNESENLQFNKENESTKFNITKRFFRKKYVLLTPRRYSDPDVSRVRGLSDEALFMDRNNEKDDAYIQTILFSIEDEYGPSNLTEFIEYCKKDDGFYVGSDISNEFNLNHVMWQDENGAYLFNNVHTSVDADRVYVDLVDNSYVKMDKSVIRNWYRIDNNILFLGKTRTETSYVQLNSEKSYDNSIKYDDVDNVKENEYNRKVIENNYKDYNENYSFRSKVDEIDREDMTRNRSSMNPLFDDSTISKLKEQLSNGEEDVDDVSDTSSNSIEETNTKDFDNHSDDNKENELEDVKELDNDASDDDSSDERELNEAIELKFENNSDDEVYNRFTTIVKDKYRYKYYDSDLITFHNSVKSNIFTILSGVSGLGKSKLASIYAESLGIKNKKQFNMVSVRPFWQDDSDVLGFVNISNNCYQPGDSGIVDTLISASNNKNELFIIVLDEMNLSKVEHYFSQFLSVLERTANDRFLRLYNPSLELDNSDSYPSEILIPNNVRIIGTMNLDDTTYSVSNKVLDRANVVNLKKVPFTTKLNVEVTNDNYDYIDQINAEEYFNSNEISKHDFSQDELQLFDDLDHSINGNIPTVSIGWRTLKDINNFISFVDYYSYQNYSTREAFDYEIAQRILPRLRGTREMIGDLIDEQSERSIFHILNKFSNISEFNTTREILNKKNKELEVFGFAN